MANSVLKIGLLGTNIGRSLAPRLWVHFGKVHGMTVQYDRFDGQGVAGYDPVQVAHQCAKDGYAGFNVTHPFKMILRPHVKVAEERIARLESVNLVRLEPNVWNATNTDFTGFLAAFRNKFGKTPPGDVVLLGAGGVGRSIGYGLGELGARKLAIYDVNADAARALAAEVAKVSKTVCTAIDAKALPDAVRSATGLANCSAVGMSPNTDNPFPPIAKGTATWAFDAIYSPLWTPFMKAARDAGLETLTGFELFLFQGLDGFRYITGLETDQSAVRPAGEAWLKEREAGIFRDS